MAVRTTSPSKAYDRIVRVLMAGRLAEVTQALDDAATDLHASELAELKAAVDFQSGRLPEPPRPARITILAWRLWVDVPFGHAIVLATLRIAAFVIASLGLADRFYERLRVARAPNVVHFRYTDFLQGLVNAAILHAFAPRSASTLSTYYRGLIGLFECLSGRFDLGLDHLREAHALLRAKNERVNSGTLVDADVYERFLSISVLLGLYLSYSGNHDEAYREYDRVLARTRTTWRYALIEIFLYSVKMYTDFECCNADSLTEGAVELKRLLGAHFRGKFGLRASIYASLGATLQGKTALARQHLALGEELYSDTISAVELARYHFLRALIHLESSEVPAARLHARRASAFFLHLRGGRFHEADALLLDLELRLRARLREGSLAFDAAESWEIERAFKRALRLVRGSTLIEVRVRALQLYLRFLRGQFAGSEVELAEVSALAQRASKRIDLVLKEIDTRRGEAPALEIAEPDVSRHHDASLLQRLAQLVGSEHLEDEAAALLTLLVAAEKCEVRTTPRPGEERPVIEFVHESDQVRVLVTGTDQCIEFTLRRPLVDLRFDRRVAELVHFVAEVIRVSMERSQILNLQRQVVLARTMQMLVHDVKRPFGALQAVMRSIATAPTAEEVQGAVEHLLPEVQRAAATVSTLIDDIIHLGNDRAPVRTDVLPEVALSECLREMWLWQAPRDLTIAYDLQHTRPWCVEGVRVRRLIQNLSVNAIQAAGARGRLWISSRDSGPSIEMVFGNDGPPISAEDLPHLFEAFFTKGKVNGTGLGLAVAQHVVMAHGGRIECRNVSPRGVEFLFTLPAATASVDARALEELRARLPRRASMPEAHIAAPPSSRNGRAALARDELFARLAFLGRPLDVLLVHDDASVLATMQSWFSEFTLQGWVRVSAQTGASAATAMVSARPPDLAVLCMKERAEEREQLLLRTLLSSRAAPYVCVLGEIHAADELVMTERHPDELRASLPEHDDARRWLQTVAARLSSSRSTQNAAHVALVDDSRVHLADWRAALRGEADLRFFPSPAAFWTESDRDPSLVDSLQLVIVDYIFLESDDDGVSFARALKRRRANLPVCLSTGGYAPEAELEGSIDVVLDKAAISWRALVERLEAKGVQIEPLT